MTFSEAVTGLASSDVVLSGTAGAATAVVSGGPTTYTIAVSGMTGNGSVIIDIPAGAAIDAASNPNVAAPSANNVVVFSTNQGVPAPTMVPTMSLTTVSLLAQLLAGLGAYFRRQQMP